MKKFSLSVACLLLASSLSANQAQKKPKMMMPLGPVHSTSGMVMPKNAFTTALKSVFIKKDQAYDGSDKIFDPTRRDMSLQRHNVIVRYGLGGGFDLRFLVPVFDKSLEMFNPRARVGGEFSNSGTGDMRMFLRYQITSQKKGDSFFSAVDLGVELPTGDTNDNFHLKNGRTLPNHNPLGMQLGDGSVDPILGLSATKLMKKHRFDASMMYFFNMKGKNDLKKGDQLNYALSYSYMLHPKFMPVLELNGKYFGKNEIDGVTQDNTGGHEIFVTPGFSSHLTKSLKFLIGYSIPIYHDMNDGALGFDGIITAKLVYKW